MNHARRVALPLAFALLLTMRVWGVTRTFWLLDDQIRDWTIALGPLTRLPLVGPPSHADGHTIGPAFYWGLWLIRVTVGPWFENLPHAGGIGQAILQSAADTLLLAGVWQRTRSAWLALAATMLIATASYDVGLSATVWNPTMGSALAKTAMALVLLEWPQRSPVGVVVAAVTAWCAVQCSAGAIFAALGVFAALLAAPLSTGDRTAFWRNAWIVAIVIAMLQLPHALQREPGRLSGGVLDAVTIRPQPARSWARLSGAFNFIQVAPWDVPRAGWLLMACGAVVAVKYRRDATLLAVTVVPQGAAIAAYALYAGDSRDPSSYLSLMPAAVLTLLLGVTAVASKRGVQMLSMAAFVASLAIVPARLRFAQTMHRMPEYGPLLDGSRKIARRAQPMGSIRTEFGLPSTSDPEFLYRILGGRIDRASPWVALIKANGAVVYQRTGGV